MFRIRRNYPYRGALTLLVIPEGAFVGREMVVGEKAFFREVGCLLDSIPKSPSNPSLEMPAESLLSDDVEPPHSPKVRPVKLRRPTSQPAAQ